MLDVVATKKSAENGLRLAVANRAPEDEVLIELACTVSQVQVYSVSGASKDSYNDKDCPDNVTVRLRALPVSDGKLQVVPLPHAVRLVVEY
jgi:alpha-L-arabinofuranosidase